MTRTELIFSFFKSRPSCAIEQHQAVDWATAEWKKRTGDLLSYGGGIVRNLYQAGRLARVARGIYLYDSRADKPRPRKRFTARQRAMILERDNYRCVMCGNGEKEGAYLQVCLLYPKSDNSGLCLADGAVFCEKHGAMVKRHGPLGAAGMMFADLGKKAEKIGDSGMANFCGEASQALGKQGNAA